MIQSKHSPSFAAEPGRPRRKRFVVRTALATAAVLAAVLLLVATCGFVSKPSGSTAAPSTASSPTGAPSTPPATPSPATPLVKTITLVASVAEPKDATPSGLTWKGVQDAGTKIGASTSLVVPASNADLPSAVETAAAGDLAVVVTMGPDAAAAVKAAAVAHPATQFFEMDVAVPTGSPANVRGIVFDEAEAGYLAGFVAGSFAGGGKAGFVGDVSGNARSANYAAGFQSGASQARAGIGVAVAYVGTSDSPDKARTAATGLVESGVAVLSAEPSLSGIGALREACGRKVLLVALDTDAWQVVPDVRSCLIASVLKRYDVAVREAILRVSAGQKVPAVTVEDASTGGIALSDFHVDRPTGLDAQLAGVLAALENGPPHPTPAPPSGSPEPPAT